METSVLKPTTYDIKKEKRFQAKKRKLEALLNLFQEEDKSLIDVKKKKITTFQEDCKSLKEELKKYTKKPEMEPCLYLTDIGQRSYRKVKGNKSLKNVKPIFVSNIYELLMKSVLGHMSPYSFKWANLEQPQNITKTVLLVIEGLPKNVIMQNSESFSNVDIFPIVVEIASSNLPFPQELTTMHKVTHFHIENEKSYSSMFPNRKIVQVKSDNSLEKPSKVHLLLSPIQLVMEGFPLPKSVFQYSKSNGYMYTKDRYEPVTANSPMFALDCEMCRTVKSNSELTRIAVVDENHEIVYESLVKPQSKIIDYLTKFSGITKNMLSGVKTKLEDVQKQLKEILPPDAIICGQSLNCDLHALKMIHPYVIDTSIIFNGSGMRAKKDSLKYLSRVHLNEDIQNNKNGHNPIEDALATMKLVQLKLNNSLTYGDACFNDNSLKETDADNLKESDKDNLKENDKDNLKDSEECSEFKSENKGAKVETENNEQRKENSFFDLTLKYEKNICLTGSEQTLKDYGDDLPKNVTKILQPSEAETIEATLNNMHDFNLSISHLDFKSSEEPDLVGKLNNLVKLIFDNCSPRTMFMVYVSGVDVSNFQDIATGMFMATIKKAT